jgi:hypothetical protein
VERALQRVRHVGAGAGAARRHHRVLVPEHQRAERLEVGDLPQALAQAAQLGRRHRPTFA